MLRTCQPAKLILLTMLFGCGQDVANQPPEVDRGVIADSLLPAVADMGFRPDDEGVMPDATSTRLTPCDNNGDCPSGYCVPSPDGERVCTALCREDEDCPQDWSCLPVANTRPDTVFICIADRQVQCLGCAQDSDCGATGDRCLPVGRSQRCLQDCSTLECPDGHSCVDMMVNDESTPLCYPDTGFCVECVDEDGDGFGNIGDCPADDCNDADPGVFPGAPERCDGIDNDCDTRADENVAAPDDENVCLSIGVCDNATPQCATGEWVCDYGMDYDGPSEARCDGLDNDCDGSSDEDFDFSSNAEHCGACGRRCELPNAIPSCANGECTAEQCEEGWHDVDGLQPNGCEYGPCIPDANGEACDGLDNDCDGLIDEGFAALDDEPDTLGEDTNCDGVDGTIARSLFVAPNGNDRNNGLTPDAPLATIGRAMRLTVALPGRDRILVQSGLYRSNETITLIGGTSMHAGYGAGFGVRDEQRATVIIAATPGLQAIALGQPTRLERFSFEIEDQDASSAAAVGLVVTESADNLELVDCDLTAGRGGDGRAGNGGLDGDGYRGIDAAGKNGGLGGPLGGGTGATGRRRASGPAGAAGNANGSQCGGSAGAGSGNGGLGLWRWRSKTWRQRG